MPAISWWEDVADALFPKMCSGCDCHSRLQIKCYLPLSIPHGKVSPFLRGR